MADQDAATMTDVQLQNRRRHLLLPVFTKDKVEVSGVTRSPSFGGWAVSAGPRSSLVNGADDRTSETVLLSAGVISGHPPAFHVRPLNASTQ